MRKKRLDRLQERPPKAEEASAVEEVGADQDPMAAPDRPLSHIRGGGSGGFGAAIAGIMHGIDADIFRDPAAVQRLEREQTPVAKTVDGTIVGIEMPVEQTRDTPPGPEKKRASVRRSGASARPRRTDSEPGR